MDSKTVLAAIGIPSLAAIQIAAFVMQVDGQFMVLITNAIVALVAGGVGYTKGKGKNTASPKKD